MVHTMIPADTNGIRDKAAIVGLGETEFSWNSGRSELQLASEAIKAACDDAGIAPQDVDGLVRYDMESNHETLLVQSLGIKNLRHWESVSYGGGAGNAVVGHAAAAIAAGFCNYVVCFRAANLRSGLRLGRARGPERIAGGARSFAAPWGNLAPAHHFGMFVRRYMHQYGATSRHFGWVAVTLREHASRNPRALRRDPITIDDHQNSRLVVDPLHVLDFCQENDGAAAIVMTTPERARALHHASTLTLVEAAAQLHPVLPAEPGSLRICAPRRGKGLRGRGRQPSV
jgi:acetyl-CoA acetyltransferase